MVVTTTSSTSVRAPRSPGSNHRGPSHRGPTGHVPDHHGLPIRGHRDRREWGPVRCAARHWRNLWKAPARGGLSRRGAAEQQRADHGPSRRDTRDDTV
ncbi:hypothetical protein I549_1028 [Mycobacterium avium subsp. avium 2285 (R)]|nr:hypothetical protein I549_1028 [Mycobacterium avium subsp. avium 2285 (R)]